MIDTPLAPESQPTGSAQSPDASARVALVTGASRGLGAALAEALAADGWHIVAVARTTGALEELDDRIQSAGGAATLVPVDINNDDAMRQICLSIYQRWGKVDLWAHTAVHVPPLSPAGHIATKDWDKTLATTLRATGSLIPMIEPLLRGSESGKALFFDDASWRDGDKAAKFFGAYAAAKAGQIALARAWQEENAGLSAERAPQVLIDTPAPMPTATRARFFPGEDREQLTTCQAEAARILSRLA
ncbi:SDR family NAD(P)-dependent oxidoreductase [Rhodobacter sp. NTK016B]|uniref:SDR family NAD(P)-dependent oxidoreductase n=2 Tax=Bacteria TaxID=2 RepID=UPI001A906D00|nr:SDR family NAD(P)-dependent oxidoreductase [Rhodobacter sp. NTK016B]MBN8291470.1 SDR family NAD(P)-dependent oxidoreductase [Rhodobacter sp. NTK016B]